MIGLGPDPNRNEAIDSERIETGICHHPILSARIREPIRNCHFLPSKQKKGHWLREAIVKALEGDQLYHLPEHYRTFYIQYYKRCSLISQKVCLLISLDTTDDLV